MSETIGSASWTVEMAFGDPPLTATGSNTWTDVTAYVRALSCRRGRSHDLDRVQPGRLTLVLANADRRFDPTYSAGAHYGDLVPNVKVRVSVIYDAVMHRVGVFYVDGWPQAYDEGNTDATVTVTGTDAFKLFAGWSTDESMFTTLLRLLRPRHWWRLGESSGDRRASDSGSGGVPLDTRRAATWYMPSLDAGSDAKSYQGDGVTSRTPGELYAYQLPATAPIDTPKSIVALVAVPNLSNESLSSISSAGGAVISTYDCSMNVETNGTVRVSYIDWSDATPNSHVLGTTDIRKRWPTVTCLVGVLNDSGYPDLWVDGVQEGTDGASVYATSSQYEAYIAGIAQQAFGGRVQHVALFDTDVSSYADDLTAAARTGHADDQTGTRIGRILDYIGWAAADRDLDTGARSVGAASPNGTKVLNYLQTIEATEQGLLFVGRGGDVTFIDIDQLRSALNHTTSQATFSDDGSNIPYRAGSLQYSLDDTALVNDCTVTGDGIAPQHAVDTTSVGAYGEHSESVATFLHDERVARNLAEYRVATRATPRLRPSTFVVTPERDPATIYTAVLLLEIGDMVAIERTPQGVGAQIAQTAVVDSVAWSITQAHEITVEITASPVDDNDWFVWGTSEWGGSDGWSW